MPSCQFSAPRPSQQHITQKGARAAHERALASACRRFHISGVTGEIAAALQARGLGALKQRVRSRARCKGAVAHRDISLADDIAATVSDDSEDVLPPQLPEWHPAHVQGDRALRRRRSAEIARPSGDDHGGPGLHSDAARTTVEPSTVADHIDSFEKQVILLRMASIEHQLDNVLEIQLGQGQAARAHRGVCRRRRRCTSRYAAGSSVQ